MSGWSPELGRYLVTWWDLRPHTWQPSHLLVCPWCHQDWASVQLHLDALQFGVRLSDLRVRRAEP